jgi:hypothetical protein
MKRFALAWLAKVALTLVMMLVMSGVVAYLRWVWWLWSGDA